MSDILRKLQERLKHSIEEKNNITSLILAQFSEGQLVRYKGNPNPAVKVMQIGRIVDVLPDALVVERYREDGSTMRGYGHISGEALASVSLADELDVDN